MTLSPFSGLEAIAVDERQQIRYDDQTFTFYTARSSERDLKQIREAVRTVNAPAIPLLVAPYADALEPLLKEPVRFFWIAPVSFSTNPPVDSRLVFTEEGLQTFINNVDENERFEIIVLPQWQTLQSTIRATTMEILVQAAGRLKTLRHFNRLWPINFTANAPQARIWQDIQSLAADAAPDAIVMAGPTLDDNLHALKAKKNIWVADTALPVLTHHGIEATAVFSADAGFASREHFIGTHILRQILVCDILVNPGVARLPFANVVTYASSHPLVQQFCAMDRPDLTPVTNGEGTVGSLMLAIFDCLFGDKPVSIYGYDRTHRRRVTHARGTAYFRRAYTWQNRTRSIESYMLGLSRRYS